MSVGANAVVHACTLQDDVVIEDDVVILDAAVVGAGSIVERGAVVFARAVLAAGQRYAGVPATAVGPVTEAERAAARTAVRSRLAASGAATAGRGMPAVSGAGYVAATVHGAGLLEMGEGASVWFGCRVEGRLGRIVVGVGANVQDNSVLRSDGAAVVVGSSSTVGHNVLLHDCVVGARVLVGMGSRLAPGTVVEDDVLLAAGSATTEGQRLEGGSMWAGRPARRIAELDERKRRMIVSPAVVYREYAREFALAQQSC